MKKILALVLFLLASQLPAQTSNTLYINAAATGPVTDSTGQVWQPDSGPPQLYNLGTPASCPTTSTTTGTPNPILYKSARVGSATAGPMIYTFQGLAAGSYQVTLYFAECFWSAAGKRVFNVQIQNAVAFSNVDIFAAVGKNVAYTLTATASVQTAGTLTISFVTIPGKDIPIIDAIQISSPQPHVATLNWVDTVNPGGSTYNIYRATGSCPAPTFTKIASSVPGFTYADPTVAPQTGYCYQITAIVAATESLPCSAVYLPGSVSSCNCQ